MADQDHGPEPLEVRVVDEKTPFSQNLPVLALIVSLAAFFTSSVGTYFAYKSYRVSVLPLITIWHQPNGSYNELTWKLANSGMGSARIKDIAPT